MVSPKTCYIIASAPRSGSHLLSSLMTATGLAGKPEEHFNPWHMGLAGDFPMDLIFESGHVQQIIESTTTPNGVFGTKAQFTQVSNFVGMQRLESLFPTPLKYIYIERKDDLHQAISLARAIQTNRYMWDQTEEKSPTFNRELIFQCLREIKIQEKGWEMHFFQNHIEPFRVVYEEFIQDTAAVIWSVLDYLGIEIPEGFVVSEPPIHKLADEVTEEWVREYRSFKD
jgi:trehalose 2-sulfotransferase